MPWWRSARRTEDLLLSDAPGRRSGALSLRRAGHHEAGSSRSICAAPEDLGPGTGLLLLHARGDEQVPYTVSEQLFAAAHEPKRLLLLPGGHHRSLQHDLELQAVSRRFVRKATKPAPY